MFQLTPISNSAWWSIDEIDQSCHRLYFYFLVLAFQIKLMAYAKQLFYLGLFNMTNFWLQMHSLKY